MIPFLRIWKFAPKAIKCKHCNRPIHLVTDDRGKYLPFRPDAEPIRDERTERGTFQVFSREAFHECSSKPKLAQGKGIR